MLSDLSKYGTFKEYLDECLELAYLASPCPYHPDLSEHQKSVHAKRMLFTTEHAKFTWNKHHDEKIPYCENSPLSNIRRDELIDGQWYFISTEDFHGKQYAIGCYEAYAHQFKIFNRDSVKINKVKDTTQWIKCEPDLIAKDLANK